MKKVFRSQGFTLIELMVVTACIGILSGFAIPAFIQQEIRKDAAKAPKTETEILDLFTKVQRQTIEIQNQLTEITSQHEKDSNQSYAEPLKRVKAKLEATVENYRMANLGVQYNLDKISNGLDLESARLSARLELDKTKQSLAIILSGDVKKATSRLNEIREDFSRKLSDSALNCANPSNQQSSYSAKEAEKIMGNVINLTSAEGLECNPFTQYVYQGDGSFSEARACNFQKALIECLTAIELHDQATSWFF